MTDRHDDHDDHGRPVRRMTVARLYREIVEQFERSRNHVHHHTHLLEMIMSNQEALDAKLAEVTATLTAGFDEVQAQIQALKDQVAAGTPIDLSSFAGLDAAVAEVSDEVQAPPPVEPPVEEPPA